MPFFSWNKTSLHCRWKFGWCKLESEIYNYVKLTIVYIRNASSDVINNEKYILFPLIQRYIDYKPCNFVICMAISCKCTKLLKLNSKYIYHLNFVYLCWFLIYIDTNIYMIFLILTPKSHEVFTVQYFKLNAENYMSIVCSNISIKNEFLIGKCFNFVHHASITITYHEVPLAQSRKKENMYIVYCKSLITMVHQWSGIRISIKCLSPLPSDQYARSWSILTMAGSLVSFRLVKLIHHIVMVRELLHYGNRDFFHGFILVIHHNSVLELLQLWLVSSTLSRLLIKDCKLKSLIRHYFWSLIDPHKYFCVCAI